jgi:hypothetical protein
MSYAKIIDNNLSRAFNLVKDLAESASFTKKGGISFDFESREVVNLTTETILVKIIFMDEKKSSKDRNTKERQIMFKTQDVGDISLYDTFTVNNIIWKIGSSIKNDGFISVANVYLEG